jgi:D-serine deaminase-like pyridoxal phosphate-dependent protein
VSGPTSGTILHDSPVLVVDRQRALRNIADMAARAARAGVVLRPHFKTHHSADVGAWFGSPADTPITVSSFEMALYFARNGWRDITVAFVAGPRDLPLLEELCRIASPSVVADDPASVEPLDSGLRGRAGLWLKVDCGYRRTGVPWDDRQGIAEFVKAVGRCRRLDFRGVLTHAGDSYSAGSRQGVMEVRERSYLRIAAARDAALAAGTPTCTVSVGDTPTCSGVEGFGPADEIRPGNYVFYDLMQVLLGSCRPSDIAARVRCRVAGSYSDRIVLHCGAVHLSKESVELAGRRIYGIIVRPGEDPDPDPGSWLPVAALTQEHAVVPTENRYDIQLGAGEIVEVLPVHSCLACWLHSSYECGSGRLDKMCPGT